MKDIVFVPLFNDYSSFSPDVLDREFERIFRQGTVGRIEIQFPQERRFKFFIVLNANTKEAEILTVISQSDPQYALNNDILKTHLIHVTPESTDNIFRKSCYIDCRNIVKINRIEIKDRFILKQCQLIGQLPENILQNIIKIVIGSSLIEIEYQERIYSNNDPNDNY